MRVRWLGWAGLEVSSGDSTLVVDPLRDTGAVFAPLGEAAAEAARPEVVAPEPGRAVAGLLSHLHRDHADGQALVEALAGGAPVYHPPMPAGEAVENLALAQADAELDACGLGRQEAQPWERFELGPFLVTAIPAVDGLGDPQTSWLVEAEGVRVLHLGDTVFHGFWWRMAQRCGPFDAVFTPINGPVVRFPHRRPASPLPVALEPEQAALAGELLGARVLVPMHYDGYSFDPFYVPVAQAGVRFQRACEDRSLQARLLDPGASFELGCG